MTSSLKTLKARSYKRAFFSFFVMVSILDYPTDCSPSSPDSPVDKAFASASEIDVMLTSSGRISLELPRESALWLTLVRT